MSKSLLIEYAVFTPKSILSEGRGDRNLMVEGVIQRADSKNQNGRVYPKDILEREVEKYVQGPISENRALGELDHPESMVINLKNVSHASFIANRSPAIRRMACRASTERTNSACASGVVRR